MQNAYQEVVQEFWGEFIPHPKLYGTQGNVATRRPLEKRRRGAFSRPHHPCSVMVILVVGGSHFPIRIFFSLVFGPPDSLPFFALVVVFVELMSSHFASLIYLLSLLSRVLLPVA